MTASITLPFRIVTLAVRHNADLVRETSAVRAAARASKALKIAGMHFPSTVLGAELLGIMSAQFQELLRRPADAVGEAPYSRSRRGEFGISESSERPANAWDGVAQDRHNAATFKPVIGAGDKARMPSQGPFPLTSSAAPATEHTGHEVSQHAGWRMMDVEGALETDRWHGLTASNLARRKTEPVGTIVRQLREYFELEHKQSAVRLSGEPVKQPRATSSPASISQGQEPRGGSERSESEKQMSLARRLRAFVSSPGLEGSSRSRWWEPGEETSMEKSSLRESSLAAPAGIESPEFAERLANILHHQAMHHGIDLT
jgi:hypothetical protein